MKITITSDIFIEGKYFATGSQADVPLRLGQNLCGMDVAEEIKAPVPVIQTPEAEKEPSPVKPKSRIP